MDVFNLCVVIALATLFLTWLLILTPFSASGRSKAKKLPPGPWRLPFIGSLHHVLSTLPHRTLAEMSRRHGPLMFLQLGELPTLVVSSVEAATLVMKTHDLAFADRALTVTMDIYSSGGSSIGSAPYGERWRQLRKAVVVGLLTGKQVKRHEGIRAQEVGKLLHSITTSAQEGAVVNLSSKFLALSNNISSRAMFSDRFLNAVTNQSKQDVFIHAVEKVTALLGGFALVDLFPSSRLVRWFSNGEREMKKIHGHIQRIISEIVRDGRAARAAGRDGAGGCTTDNDEDMLEALLRIQEEDTLPFPLTTELIGAVLLEVFAAGTETSATVLGWAMSELFNSPKIMAKVQSEVRQVLGPDKGVITNTDLSLSRLPFMQMVVKEAFRTHPPVPLLVPRKTREDCNIMGYDIPKGTNVIINVFAISRDPRYWESPQEFKPERFEKKNVDYYGTHFEFTPFGAGRRQCPGILFGASTVEIGLANLLYHFDWVHPSGSAVEPLDMTERHGISIGRRFDLELIATPHVPSTAA